MNMYLTITVQPHAPNTYKPYWTEANESGAAIAKTASLTVNQLNKTLNPLVLYLCYILQKSLLKAKTLT